MTSRPISSALQGLASEVATDPELGRVYREYVVEPRRLQMEAVVERGIRRRHGARRRNDRPARHRMRSAPARRARVRR